MSSRIIVKNLPKNYSEERFREHFSSKGEVTDARLMHNAQGDFRRFGYIGPKAALRYFNNTFIDTSKIVVEEARPYGDAALPRPWSVYTKGTTLYNRAHGIDPNEEKKKVQADDKQRSQRAIRTLYEEILAGNQDDPRFKEFLQAMAPRAKNKTWTNDDYANWQDSEIKAVEKAVAARREQIEGKGAVKNKAKVEMVVNKKPGGAGQMVAKTHVKFGDSDDEGEGEDEDEEDEAAGDDSKNDNLSDLDWLRMHMSSKLDDEDVFGEAAEPAKPEADPETKSDEQAASAEDAEKIVPTDPPTDAVMQIQETGRLFLRNLPSAKAFEKFGPLSEVHMPISKDTKRPKGFAYILYLLPEHAVKAFKAMDNQYFMGRLLHVLPGKEKPQAREREDQQGGFKSNVKKERDAKLKAQAGSDFNWNSLYMSADAVADSIADRLKIAKADLLSADSTSNPAVRLALAETHIINDTKRFFEEQGVRLERFEKRERSDTVVLVKNIPFSIDEDELRALFGKYGSLGRVLVPPSRTIAIVEFLEPSEARTAFRHLAYKRIKDAPIYLERAPKEIFTTAYDPAMDAERAEKAKAVAESKAQVEKVHEAVHDTAQSHVSTQGASAQGEVGRVLFVKNLNFDTNEDTLRQLFGGVDGLASVAIRRKKDPKRPGKWQSMGFGFVEYKTAEAAQQALKSFQGAEVDDHALEIKMSDRVAKTSAGDTDESRASLAGAKKPKGTKIVVKNVPFEATRKDIRDLIATFGQIKSVRLPKKFSGGHRGFAFVEFLTPQEAQHVLDTVKDTHLYGRHLVLDWAEEENSLSAIREKVGRQFAKDSGEQGAGSKRRKIEMEADGDEDMSSDSD
ncbi:RNA-binding domain-containing protein [Linderina pennispora]|uniref:RNA-binding domain-containing protein n=1 Tax=Linderina pennispora TaxID=61395 RepID=A0A1Y1WN01_9FUNG|nr:RNA-binding domain-containing protein [Linderina pennispora]ORX74678.1 RNA-binding domain-containing protein [Linderina pennispora]